MRIKNLRGVSEVRFKKTRLFHLENVENHLVRNFLRNGRSRVKSCSYECVDLRITFFLVPEPYSLCTLPLNEGNCTTDTAKSNEASQEGLGLLSSITQTRYYFDPSTSSCKKFEFGRCGGNSNNFMIEKI